MTYQRVFDEEPTRVSEISCVNDGWNTPSYAFALTTSDLTVEGVAPNIYRAFLDGMDPAATVAFMTRRISGSSITLPAPNTPTPTPPVPEFVTLFPGNTMVRIRVMAGKQVLVLRMVSGTGTLYLVPTIYGPGTEE